MDGIAYLLSSMYREDELGQKILEPVKREILCSTKSVSKSEYFSAGQFGLRAERVIITPAINYENEETVEYEGKTYFIYRTYRVPESDDIELYLELRSGTNVKNNQTGQPGE